MEGVRAAPAPAPAMQSGKSNRLELFAAAMLAVATILTAWSAFQATKWGGVMAIRFSEANADRTNAAIASDTANAERSIDVTIFAEYLSALAQDETELVEFLEARFRDEFTVAFDAWVATDPRTNPQAPPSPFAMDEYQLASQEEATRLTALAELRGEEARDANQRGDNYVLTTVLFAAVLFFGGVSTKFGGLRAQQLSIVTGMVLLVVGAVILATFPIEV